MQNDYCVYKHTAPNGKVYIGITSMKPLKRWANGNGYKSNKHFSSAIAKYGWQNITHEVLFVNLSKNEAEKKEIELIKLYDSSNREHGYNIDHGGNTQGKISEESRAKMSKSHKGVSLSASHRAGLCRGRRNRKTQPNQGKHLSESWRKAVSEGVSKAVVQCDMEGNQIAVYSGQKTAEQATGVCSTNISRCCRGERKQAGGYIWRFINDSENKRVS